MENSYYVPDISEFVEGFEFQVALDKDTEEITLNKSQANWVNKVMPNMDPIEYPFCIRKDGCTLTLYEPTVKVDLSYGIKLLLKAGLIRAKK